MVGAGTKEGGGDDELRNGGAVASEERQSSRPRHLTHASTPSALPSFASGIPTDLLLALLLDKTLLASSALLARHWLLTGHSESIHNSPIIDKTGTITDDADSKSALASSGASAIVRGTSSPWAIATTIFIFAAIAQTAWFRSWQWLPALRRSDPQMKVLPKKLAVLGSIMFFSAVIWFLALERLGATTVILFTQFCEVWAGDLARSMKSRAHGSYIIVAALFISFLAHLIFPPTGTSSATEASSSLGGGPLGDLWLDEDLNELPPSLRHTRPVGLASPSALRAASLQADLEAKSYSPAGVLFGHLCLLVFGLLCVERDRATVAASTESGGRRRAQVLACTVTAGAAAVIGIFGSLLGLSTLPPLSTFSPNFHSSAGPTYTAPTQSGHLPAYILLALSLFILEPLVGAAIEPHANARARVTQGWPLAVSAVVIVGKVGFGLPWKWSDAVVAIIVGWGLRTILKTSPVFAHDDGDGTFDGNGNVSSSSKPTHRRSVSDAAALTELLISLKDFLGSLKSTVGVILAQPDSRKIFQFLCLNLVFMVVQLIWGTWTNSLGLISDAIHMFFDCAAIGMGLFAAIMASWKTDKTFTYGYGRVETLSGFANGVFLILISVFIVFEAVQRIIVPPVMHNTHELLIVSSMGLGVNLFGMWATGGHHHHGHSHGHSHDHGHNHGHGHGHGHSHNMMGVYLHVMADTMGSVGVILSTLLIEWYGWTGFDPIASLFIAFMIVASVVPLVVDAGRILCLDLGDSREKEVQEALEALQEIEGVASWSEPRFWPKDAETLVGTIRVQVRVREKARVNGGDSRKGGGEEHEVAAAPLMTEVACVPEEVAAAVDALLKSRIEGLEMLSIQLERGAPGGSVEDRVVTHNT